MKVAIARLAVAALLGGAAIVSAQAPNASALCNSGTTLAEFLPPADAERATHFLDALKSAVHDGDKARVASMVHFPVKIYTLNHGYRTIHNASELQAQYDRVFDSTIRAAVLRQVPSCMFANYRGVMVGDGEVWARDFDGTYLISSFNRK